MSSPEKLPNPPPLAAFFVFNFVGIFLALILERFGVEEFLSNRFLAQSSHPYAVLGLGVFAIASLNSYLGGSVVIARFIYNVPLPDLYASTTTTTNTTGNDDDDKHNKIKNENAILFNCIQRGHQNFLETYAQVVLSVLFTAMVANRPCIAGMLLLVISIGRVFYAMGYKKDIKSRMIPFLLSMFSMSVGIGYAFLVGISAFGIQLLNEMK